MSICYFAVTTGFVFKDSATQQFAKDIMFWLTVAFTFWSDTHLRLSFVRCVVPVFSFLLQMMRRRLLGRGLCFAKYCSRALRVTYLLDRAMGVWVIFIRYILHVIRIWDFLQMISYTRHVSILILLTPIWYLLECAIENPSLGHIIDTLRPNEAHTCMNFIIIDSVMSCRLCGTKALFEPMIFIVDGSVGKSNNLLVKIRKYNKIDLKMFTFRSCLIGLK